MRVNVMPNYAIYVEYSSFTSLQGPPNLKSVLMAFCHERIQDPYTVRLHNIFSNMAALWIRFATSQSFSTC